MKAVVVAVEALAEADRRERERIWLAKEVKKRRVREAATRIQAIARGRQAQQVVRARMKVRRTSIRVGAVSRGRGVLLGHLGQRAAGG